VSDDRDLLEIDFNAVDAKSLDAVAKLFETARAAAVFSPPVRAGEYTVVTASEVLASGGAGFGGGVGKGPSRRGPRPEAADAAVEPGTNAGVGGGGGGFTLARPVAAISVGPDGVRIQSIVDTTKIAIAALTTVGAMALMLARLVRAGRE